MTRVARSLTWPNVQDLEAWKDVMKKIIVARDANADFHKSDNEADFVRDVRRQLFAQRRVVSEKQAKWLWDIYCRI